jgi:hypothetical protein
LSVVPRKHQRHALNAAINLKSCHFLRFNWLTPSKEIGTSSVAAFDQNGFSGAAISRPCTMGKVLGMLCIVDEFSRVRPAVPITRKLKADDVIEALCDQVVSSGIRAHIRSAEAPIQANRYQRIARSAPAIATSISRLAGMVGSFGQRPVAWRIRTAHPRTRFVVLEGAAREPHISRCRIGEIPCERRMSEEIGLRRRQPLRAIFSGISQS